jgi:DNA ligase-1
MLLMPYDSKRIAGDAAAPSPSKWYVSEKYDGWRCLYREGHFYTRSGDAITHLIPKVFKDFVSTLPSDLGDCLDAELWLGYDRFNDIRAELAACKTSDEKENENVTGLQLMIFDAPNAKGGFKARYRALKKALATLDTDKYGNIKLVKQRKVTSTSEIDAIYERIVAKGGEGIVVKPSDQIYVSGARPPTYMKRKPVQFTEAVVTGHTTSATAAANYIVSLVCEVSDDDKQVSFKVQYKSTKPMPIGTVIRVKHNDYTRHGLPKFPVFMGIRDPVDRDQGVTLRPPPYDEEPEPNTRNQKQVTTTANKVKQLVVEDLRRRGATPPEDICRRGADPPGPVLTPGKSVVVKSMTQPTTTYTVTMSKTGDCVYCSCQAWKYQRLNPLFRMCKHTIEVFGEEALEQLINNAMGN